MVQLAASALNLMCRTLQVSLLTRAPRDQHFLGSNSCPCCLCPHLQMVLRAWAGAFGAVRGWVVQGTEELGTHIFTRVCLASLGQLPPLHQSSQNWSPLPLDAKVRAHLFTSNISPQMFFIRRKKVLSRYSKKMKLTHSFMFWPMFLDQWIFWEVCGNRNRRWRSWHFKDVFCTHKKSTVNTFWIHEFAYLYGDIFLIEIQGQQMYGSYTEIQDTVFAGEEQVLYPVKTPTALGCMKLFFIFCS